MFDVLIVGAGVTGLLALSILVHNKVQNIGIIDPRFCDGDLIEKYGSVQSNTPLEKTVNALKMIDTSYEAPSNLVLDKTAQLYIHTQLVKEFAQKYLQKVVLELAELEEFEKCIELNKFIEKRFDFSQVSLD